MMKITLRDEYKSLHPFESDELSDLVITGKNGSGKSQLLNLIGRKAANDNEVKLVNISVDPKIYRVQYEGVWKGKNIDVNYNAWTEIIRQYSSVFAKWNENTLKLIDILAENNADITLQPSQIKNILVETKEYENFIEKLHQELSQFKLCSLKNLTLMSLSNEVRS